MPRLRAVSALAALAMVAGGGLAAWQQRPVPPPPLSPATTFGAADGDGMGRFVVTLDAVLSARDAAAVAGLAGPDAPVDRALLAAAEQQLGTGGTLADSPTGVLYSVGAASALVSPAPSGGSAGVHIAPVYSQPTPAAPTPLAALSAAQGVAHVQALGDGTLLVATRLDAAALMSLPGVASVAPSAEVAVAAQPSDPYYVSYGWNEHNTGSNAFQQQALAGADIDAPTAWDATRGEGAVVAVVDTGMAISHADLAGALWTNPAEPCGSVDTDGNGLPGDCHGWNFYAGSADVTNGGLGSHGTSVAGVIAARWDGAGIVGVAPRARIMPLVVGGGSSIDPNLAAVAFRYAADHGATVINASFGGGFDGPTLTRMSQAIDYAASKGVLVVAAAGNDAGDRDTNLVYPASMPNDGLVVVGSTSAMDAPAATSGFGARNVDLFAPGELIATTWDDGGYRAVSGTSIAAPQVAASVALLASLHPGATAAELKTMLLAATEPLPALAGKAVTGGRLSLSGLADGASYTFAGMVADPAAGPVQPTVTVASPAAAGDFAVRIGLGMRVDDAVWALSGASVTLDGTTATTDDEGSVTIELGTRAGIDGLALTPALGLAEGSYALTVQLLKDGEPLSRPYAAPLEVRTSAGPAGSGSGGGSGPADAGSGAGAGDAGAGDGGASGGGSTGGGSTGGGPAGDGSAADSSTGGGSAGGGSAGGGATGGGSGGSTGGGSTGGGSAGDGSTGGGSAGGGGSSGGSTGAGSSAGGGSTGGSGGSGGSGSGTTDPGAGPAPTGGSGGSGGGTGAGTAPSTPNAGTGTPAQDGTDARDYPSVGDFALTRIAPVHVTTDGGTLVVIYGSALDGATGARVGGTPAHVVAVMAGGLYLLSPAVPAGTYDVTVFGSGRSSTLLGALEVAAPTPTPGVTPPPAGSGGSSGGSGTQPGGTQPGGTQPGTTQPPTGPTGGSTGGGSTGGGSGDGTQPPTSQPGGSGGSGGGSQPGTTQPPASGGDTGSGTGSGAGSGTGSGTTAPSGPVTRSGPHGERLVQSASFSGLSGLWSMTCSTSCTGLRL